MTCTSSVTVLGYCHEGQAAEIKVMQYKSVEKEVAVPPRDKTNEGEAAERCTLSGLVARRAT